MGEIALAILLIAAIRLVHVFIDSMFDPIYNWLDGAIIELDEESLSNYSDNSEYDWGHNVKGYHYEDEQDL